MRVGLTLNNACQPLRNLNFGKANDPQKTPVSNPSCCKKPAFSAAETQQPASGETVSKEQYDKVSRCYDVACKLLYLQTKQYKELAAEKAGK